MKCLENQNKLINSNGGLCEVVRELMGNYKNGGQNLDSESYRWIEFHIYDCAKCANYMAGYNSAKELEKIISLEDGFFQELDKQKKVCLFLIKKIRKIISKSYGEKPYSYFLNHCRSCKKCMEKLEKLLKLVEEANTVLENWGNVDCKNFCKYQDFYKDFLLSDEASVLMQNHFLLCQGCNDRFVYSLNEYTDRFCISNRSGRIKIE